MKRDRFKPMSTDNLWAFHQQICSALSTKMVGRKQEIERRFYLVNRAAGPSPADDPRTNGQHRAYPRVSPKYRNPLRPSETWSGRGKQPRWLAAQLGSGRQRDDFLIESAPIDRPGAT
jgi:DNA-binding protein H-NS